MTSPRPERVAVLLMAYGGPNSLEDIPAYLSDVRHGRPYSPAFLEELTERYRQIGGRSPILELTQAQAAGIARALNDGSEAGRVPSRPSPAGRTSQRSSPRSPSASARP
jgi:protoheme ferro-lyase